MAQESMAPMAYSGRAVADFHLEIQLQNELNNCAWNPTRTDSSASINAPAETAVFRSGIECDGILGTGRIQPSSLCVLQHAGSLQAQYQFESIVQTMNEGDGQPADALRQQRLVDREQLRNVDYRFSFEPRMTPRQHDVAGCIS